MVDEAWKVQAGSVDEGLTPTMAEREQPQLCARVDRAPDGHPFDAGGPRRRVRSPGNASTDLLIEWSAPEGAEIDDAAAWRQASPHWTTRRRRLVGKALERARAGEIEDPDEPDPESPSGRSG